MARGRKRKDSRIKAAKFGSEMTKLLEIYSDDVAEGVNAASSAAIDEMVKRTKATAPVGSTGFFKRRITHAERREPHGMVTHIWCVKAPDYRLTHLLVHGHVTPTGGRTKADPFLKNAVDAVLPDYEKAVEEAIKNA